VTESSGSHVHEPGPPDPAELLRSRRYLALLVLGAALGVPISAVAYFFLKVVSEAQRFLFSTLPGDLGFDGPPTWWPVPVLAAGGLLVALAIIRLPGGGGHNPARGFTSAATRPMELPGVFAAALATLCFGAVLGPEAPLIAVGSGLGALALQLGRRDAPAQATAMMGATGSFAAVSTLLGSPIVGAFLLMEAAGLGGPMLGVVLVPGMLAAGVGALIFVGLDSWTGYGTFSLAIPEIPAFGTPTAGEFAWAIAIGLAAAVLGTAIRRLALAAQPAIERRRLLLTPVAGVAIAGLAIIFHEATGHASSQVLFSGQSALGPMVEQSAEWTAGALTLVVACKALAYSLSLSGFRGGPIFPALFIGAAGGMALSHLPGLPLVAGAAMGTGAMCVAMLGLPLSSVLLAALLFEADGLGLAPLIIVTVVVSYVASARLAPAPAAASEASPAHAPVDPRRPASLPTGSR
jgi:H+/Cl- antiporter ClcA